ncbi:hypothetical protein EVAR_18089_1 [Eumeta japonica]|uniref:Uncharacterized protein n=1 Tax=Eumeta variegata TaxID=151549 RepID=A0A4C1VHZ5_EUMVA|nr:hypothetical protein EVAR_18089_1 [Eumeta japonica]
MPTTKQYNGHLHFAPLMDFRKPRRIAIAPPVLTGRTPAVETPMMFSASGTMTKFSGRDKGPSINYVT